MSAVAMIATTVPQADLYDAANWDPSHLFDVSALLFHIHISDPKLRTLMAAGGTRRPSPPP